MAGISALLLMGALFSSFMCVRYAVMACLNVPSVHASFSKQRLHALYESLKERVFSWGPLRRIYEKALHKKRAEEFEQGMPEVLRLLCTALESGSSLVQALKYASDNCKEPLAGELKRTVWDLDAGQGFDEALEQLRARTHGSEFAYLAVAMEIQHRSGGSLTDILESTRSMLQQSADLKEDLRTKTSQGRLSSRIVAIMPFALLAILSLFSPDYLADFLASPLGLCLFVLALMLDAVGVLLVRRTLAIDFSVDLDEAA